MSKLRRDVTLYLYSYLLSFYLYLCSTSDIMFSSCGLDALYHLFRWTNLRIHRCVAAGTFAASREWLACALGAQNYLKTRRGSLRSEFFETKYTQKSHQSRTSTFNRFAHHHLWIRRREMHHAGLLSSLITRNPVTRHCCT